MSLLTEIQASLLEGREIGPILLKLRFLASRLGSDVLEDWVKHESEGYPSDVEVPSYRKIGIAYAGTFSGPLGSGMRNAPIPSYLVEKYAGPQWTSFEVRESVSAIDDLIASGEKGTLTINASNLILLLQGHVYEDYACNSVVGTVARSTLVGLQNNVRARVLELTIQIEKSIPSVGNIALGESTPSPAVKDREVITQITQQIIHGNQTNISSSGPGAEFHLTFNKGDSAGLVQNLAKAGIAELDAKEIAELIASEKPESLEEPLGTKAKAWLVKNLKKATDGTWKVGVSVATQVLTEAALRYWGLK